MPDFGNPFGGLAKDRQLTDTELVRAIRFISRMEKSSLLDPASRARRK